MGFLYSFFCVSVGVAALTVIMVLSFAIATVQGWLWIASSDYLFPRGKGLCMYICLYGTCRQTAAQQTKPKTRSLPSEKKTMTVTLHTTHRFTHIVVFQKKLCPTMPRIICNIDIMYTLEIGLNNVYFRTMYAHWIVHSFILNLILVLGFGSQCLSLNLVELSDSQTKVENCNADYFKCWYLDWLWILLELK